MFQDTFKALNDPIRRHILEMLKEKRMSAGDIAQCFDMSQATISYHLSILKKADLIYEQKEKNYIYYALNASIFQEMLLYFKQFTKGDYHEK